MSGDRSNAGQRILNSKRTIRGAQEALENYIGHALQDGCQCFVHEEQANYRFLASSKIKADGKYIVAPHTGPGRWFRESGLVGFALLENGTLREGTFQDYKYQMLVQFEMREEGLVYVGTVPRVALFFGTSESAPQITIVVTQKELARSVGRVSIDGHVSGSTVLHPGDRVALRGVPPEHHPVEAHLPPSGFLQVILT